MNHVQVMQAQWSWQQQQQQQQQQIYHNYRTAAWRNLEPHKAGQLPGAR